MKDLPREALETWANWLLDHSLGGVGPGDVVMIKGERITWPLMSILQDKVIQAGAVPDVNVVAPDNDRGKVWGAAMARHGTLEQIERVPAWHRDRYDAMTKYVELLGAEMPELFQGLPEETAQAIMRVDEPYKEIRLSKPWVITLFPTEGFAAMEGMPYDEYVDVILAASTADPRELERIGEPIRAAMDRAGTIRIVTEHPDDGRRLELSMSIENRRIQASVGYHNWPDGEVFTSPDARTPEGEIFVDMPIFYAGETIEGIYLRFEGGVIRDYSAKVGGAALAKIVETDEGSHRLGEVALGTNPGIRRVLRHPLYVEKVGGTLHIAIGASYPQCYVEDPNSPEGRAEVERLVAEGVVNRSAQHVDIVTDFRPGGSGREVWLDDVRLEVRDGNWVVP